MKGQTNQVPYTELDQDRLATEKHSFVRWVSLEASIKEFLSLESLLLFFLW